MFIICHFESYSFAHIPECMRVYNKHIYRINMLTYSCTVI